ncbi:unnamed protein product [Commensalibacter communis]|nr:unnamed protein product [Commensalibacter communis]CAI3954366.1 unnamed protein product [Commensalibacter communis]
MIYLFLIYILADQERLMKSLFHPFYSFGCAVGLLLAGSAVAQNRDSNTHTEQWQVHTTKDYQTSPQNNPVYHKAPSLKPAKKNIHNPLRHKGWHTVPDPYIEEGGVYTNKTHPASTQHGKMLHDYSDGSPNSHAAPPSTVMNPYRKGNRQQAVKIQNPIPGNVAPIPLPPEKD